MAEAAAAVLSDVREWVRRLHEASGGGARVEVVVLVDNSSSMGRMAAQVGAALWV
jgi:Mg-chelatase subunit ChlD